MTVKTWLITGCDKGMGHVFATTLLELGERVVVTALNTDNVASLLAEHPDTAMAFALDVTRPDDIRRVINEAEQRTGGLDIVVNNAGYGLLGPVEATTPEEYRPLFEVDFFGAAEVIRAVLPHMRRRRQGYIINTSSSGGFSASPGFGFYAAAKFAIEGLSEAVARDTAALGLKVTILEPGSTRTDFAGGSMARVRQDIEDYQSTAVSTTYERMAARHGTQPGDPRRIAHVLYKFSRMENPPLRFTTGEDGVDRMRTKLIDTSAELDRFEALSRAVEFESEVDIDNLNP